MDLIKTSKELIYFRKNLEDSKLKVGFVPTMGALHKGHLSLVDEAAKQTDIVIVSIFVNPTQFNDPNDLKNYPRNLVKDIELLSVFPQIRALFVPDVKDIYPEPETRVFDFGNLDKIMEGAHRPGHFNGVAQIIIKLFNLVKPHKAFFGQKDFQQVAIVKNIVQQFKFNIEIIACPIIREPDGLAMSSRNQLLSPLEREHASSISRVLSEAQKKASEVNVENLKEWTIFTLNKDPLIRVEYFEIVDSFDLKPVISWKEKGLKVGCIAVKIGKIRLIDNIIFN
jgi:pantoate--beta-alanine ligase